MSGLGRNAGFISFCDAVASRFALCGDEVRQPLVVGRGVLQLESYQGWQRQHAKGPMKYFEKRLLWISDLRRKVKSRS